MLGNKGEESLSQAAVHSVLGDKGWWEEVCLSSIYRENHQSMVFMIEVWTVLFGEIRKDFSGERTYELSLE